MAKNNHEENKKKKSDKESDSTLSPNDFVKISSKINKHLGVLSQYLLLLVPFICKFIVKTVEEIRTNNKTFACQDAMRSGFWNEEMKNFNHCLDKLFKKSKCKDVNNNAKCRSPDKKLLFNEDDESQAIEEIWDAIKNKKLNMRYLKTGDSISRLIDDWATEIAKTRKKKKQLQIQDEIVKDPMKYFTENYNLTEKKQNKNVKKACHILQQILFDTLKSDGLNDYFNYILSQTPDKNKIIKKIFKDLSKNGKNSSMYPIDYSDESPKHKTSDSSDSSECSEESLSDHSSFYEKYDLSKLVECECHNFNLPEFPQFSFLNSDGRIISIPNWEIERIINKYFFSPEEAPKPEAPKLFAAKKVDEFGNLQSQLALKRAQTQKKKEIKKKDIKSRIKAKQ